jgi:secreted PhoX family phosphatase
MGAGSVKGRLFEVTNPISAGQYGGNFVWRTNVPRVAHEGSRVRQGQHLVFRRRAERRLLYKYVSANPEATSGDEFFAAGQSFALRVGAGGQNEGNNGPAITGAATWVAITNATGGAIPGVSTVLPDGTIDGRVSADNAAVKATGYNRPEDIEIQTLADGTQLLLLQHDRLGRQREQR